MIPRFPARAALAAALILSASPAVGQTPLIEKKPLVPRTPGTSSAPIVPAASGTGITTTPATPVAPAAPSTGDAANTDRRDGVDTIPLEKPDPNMIGLLGPAEGALPIEMWRGTPRGAVRELIARIPAPIFSPTLRNLARRLLLSPVALGEITEAEQKEGLPNGVIFARLERLMALGAVSNAQELGQLALNARPDADVRRLVAEAGLLTQDYGQACRLVTDGTTDGDFLTEAYWQRLLTFCQILAGDLEGAALGTELLSDREDDTGGMFHDLARRLIAGADDQNPQTQTGAQAKNRQNPVSETGIEATGIEATGIEATGIEATGIETAAELEAPAQAPSNAIEAAMLRLANLPIADNLWAEIPLAVTRAVALNPNATLETRMVAMERAAAAGAADISELAELYTAARFEEEFFADPQSSVATMPAPRGRALLYQAALSEEAPATQLTIAGWALATAQNVGIQNTGIRNDGGYALTAELYLPLIKDIAASPELARFAPIAVRIFHAAGETELARNWATAAQDAGESTGEKTPVIDELILFAMLTRETDSHDAPAQWRDARLATREANSSTKSDITLGLALIETTDTVVPMSVWREQAAAATAATEFTAAESAAESAAENPTPPALHITMRRSAAERRVGETLTLILAALARTPQLPTDPLLLQDAIAALNTVGLTEEATALAVEAALGAGL